MYRKLRNPLAVLNDTAIGFFVRIRIILLFIVCKAFGAGVPN